MEAIISSPFFRSGFDFVPLVARQLLTDCLNVCAAHMASGAPDRVHLGLALLQLLPFLTLLHLGGKTGRAHHAKGRRGSSSGGGGNSNLLLRLSRFRDGDWAHLACEAWAELERRRAVSKTKRATSAFFASSAPPSVRSRTDRCRWLCAAGELSRGLKALLTTSGTRPPGEDTTSKLQAKHPASTAFDFTPYSAFATPPDERITISTADVLHAARTCPRRSAPGPSGLRFEHLTSALMDDPALRAHIAKFTQLLIDGAVAEDIIRLTCLNDARLVALEKENDDVRPIAIGDSLRRLLSRVVLRKVRSEADSCLAPTQLGVGYSGGAEAIFHAASSLLHRRRDLCVVAVDLSNAFNSVNRDAVLSALLASTEFRRLLPFVRLFYNTSNPSLWLPFNDDDDDLAGLPPHIASQRGVQQGDVLAPLLFALAIHPAISSLREQHDLNAWFLDDGTIVTTPAAVPSLVHLLASRFAALGLALNNKTKVLWLHGELPASARNLGVECYDTTTPEAQRGFKLLGAPCGSGAYTRAFLDKKLAKSSADCETLTSLLRDDPQTALLLLRKCISPRPMYLLRCLPPHLTDAFAAAFDSTILATFHRILYPDASRPPLPEHARLRAVLRPTDGGVGLSCSAQCNAAAYASSVAFAAPTLATACSPLASTLAELSAAIGDDHNALNHYDGLVGSFAAAAFSLPPASLDVLRRALAAASEVAEDGGAAAGVDGDVEGRWIPPHSPGQLQSRVSKPINSEAHLAWCSRLDITTAMAAQHLSQRGDLGTAWLEAVPNDANAVAARSFRLALFIFLNLPIAALEGRRCRCNAVLTAATGARHIANCKRHEFTTRHNTFAARWDDVLRSLPAGVSIVGEGGQAPSLGTITTTDRAGSSRTKAVIPDRVVSGLPGTGPGSRELWDFTVVDASATSYADAASIEPLSAAAYKHGRKLMHYGRTGSDGRAIMQPGDVCVPIAAELHGGLHRCAWKRLRDLAELAVGTSGDSGKTLQKLLWTWRVHLSVGLLAGRVGEVEAGIHRLDLWALERGEGPLAQADRHRHNRIFDVCSRPSALDFSSPSLRCGGGGRGR